MVNPPSIDSVHGRIRSITGDDPAASAEILVVVPARRRWRLLSVRFTLDTNAVAANRTVQLIIDDGTNTLAQISATTPQVANTLQHYTYLNVSFSELIISLERFYLLPASILSSGFRIKTYTTNFQSTDDLSAPQLLVEEWIDP